MGSAKAGPAAGGDWELSSSIVPRDDANASTAAVRSLLPRLLARRLQTEAASNSDAPSTPHANGLRKGAAVGEDRPATRRPGLSSAADADAASSGDPTESGGAA